MKQFLLLCFLFVGMVGYAQSKRQLNKQLKTEYAVLDMKVDSLMAVVSKELKLETERTRIFEEATDSMRFVQNA